jgi:predicted nucleic acid-binding protein
MLILDSDIAIDLLRNYPPANQWIESFGNENFLLPGYGVMELYKGSKDQREKSKVERLLKRFFIIWPSQHMCEKALSFYDDVHLRQGIGLLDTLIGFTALEQRRPLHSFNKKHLSLIPGLEIIAPYKK